MYCLDTYALWEILNGNQKYVEVILSDFVITDWTLAEFYKTLLRQFDRSVAEYWMRKFEHYSMKVNLAIMKKAIDFQHENKKANMSLFDCVGYIFSLENNWKFVTGDKEFRTRPGVKFIK